MVLETGITKAMHIAVSSGEKQKEQTPDALCSDYTQTKQEHIALTFL